MAIINNKVKAFKDDRNENVFIGIDLPFRLGTTGEGYFSTSKTTIEAVIQMYLREVIIKEVLMVIL